MTIEKEVKEFDKELQDLIFKKVRGGTTIDSIFLVLLCNAKYFEYKIKQLGATDKFIKQIKEIAKQDLKNSGYDISE